LVAVVRDLCREGAVVVVGTHHPLLVDAADVVVTL
jgi:hypothetical protein